MQLYGNEKDKANLFNIERREKIVHDVFLRTAQLSQTLKDYKPRSFDTVGEIRQPWEDPVHPIAAPSSSSSSSSSPSGSLSTPTNDTKCLGTGAEVGSRTTNADNNSSSSSSSSSKKVDQIDENNNDRTNSNNLDSADQPIHAVRAVHMEEQNLDPSIPEVEISKVAEKNLTRNVSFSLNERDIRSHAITDVSLMTSATRAAESAMGDLEYLLSSDDNSYGDDSHSNGSTVGDVGEQRSGLDDTGAVCMTVVFDGTHRALCDFKIQLTPSLLVDGDLMNGEAKGISKVTLIEEIGEEETRWVREHLISSVSSDQDLVQLSEMIPFKSIQDSGIDSSSSRSENGNDQMVASVELTQFTDLDEDLSVFLGHKTVRPKIEDDDISRMMYVDRLSYTGNDLFEFQSHTVSIPILLLITITLLHCTLLLSASKSHDIRSCSYG